MEIFYAKISLINEKLRSLGLTSIAGRISAFFISIFKDIKAIGVIDKMDEYEKRKLSIFNQLNFFQLITGILIPLFGIIHKDHLPYSAWLFATLPCITSLLVLGLNAFRKYDAALIGYFILYPFFTCIVYLHGMNSGISLHFILYGILSVFFLQDIGYMLFTIALSMVSYFMLSVVLKDFIYELETENKLLYLLNQLLAILFIFYGLFLIKKENANYQYSILSINRSLNKMNLEIQAQKEVIDQKAEQLELQAHELSGLNSLKTKLFSVIAHDLKSPMYALRNLFRNVDQFNVSHEEMKTIMPDVINDLNYTISLMENLLQWAKIQMESENVQATMVDIKELITEVMHVLRLQAEAKKLYIENRLDKPLFVYADKEMINLVLRNFISNAIKFTPEKGQIKIGASDLDSFVEVYVQDSGLGISNEAMDLINANNFYTTKGTSSESGTGLGLMLCKEYLSKNGGRMHIESEPGKGSTFSFTLPSVECDNL